MPTVLRQGPYRFFFFSNEGSEPRHIHVESAGKYAKYWLEPITFENSVEFRAHDLVEIRRIIEENQQRFIEAWDEHFGTS
ncbi:MAG: DUF4160 domain-containing protein [Fimbriimonas sp.]